MVRRSCLRPLWRISLYCFARFNRLQWITVDNSFEIGIQQWFWWIDLNPAESWCSMAEVLGRSPFSEGFRVLFIGVGGPDLAQTSGDFFWHVSGPTRPTPPSFVSIWHRFEVISNPSRNGPIELKLGRNNLYLVWKLLWKFRCIWISGLGDMIDTR